MKTMHNSYSVVAIIVTYNPDLKITESLISSIKDQVSNIILVDNGSSEEITKELAIIEQEINMEVINLNQNVGLATAQNLAIKKVKDVDFSHYIFFDQDSVPNKDMIFKMLEKYEYLLDKNYKVGALGPKFIDSRNNYIYNNESTLEYENVDFLIASGSLIPKKTIEKVGLMRDEFFIYQVDRDWCYRALNEGYDLFRINNATMTHTIGENSIKIWMGKWWNMSVHKPRSHYYVLRNSIILLKENHSPNKWKLKTSFKLIFIFIFFSTLNRERKENFKMMSKGIKDGINKKTGPYKQKIL